MASDSTTTEAPTTSADEFALAAPWITYVREMMAFFQRDPDVVVDYDEEANVIDVIVDGLDKAVAAYGALAPSRTFGSVTVRCRVRCADGTDIRHLLLSRLLAGNAQLARIEHVDSTQSPMDGRTYVLFKPDVVQFFNDDLSDYHKVRTTLMQEIARDVVDVDGVSWCTELLGV